MNEQQWLECGEVEPMLRFHQGKVSERKLRLFACACCRCHRSVYRAKRNRKVLEAAEDFADGFISRKEMDEQRQEWFTFDYPFPLRGTWQAALSWATMTHSSTWALEAATHAALASARPGSAALLHTDFLRDICGNPFRPVAIAPAWLCWRDGLIRWLAEAAYQERYLPSGCLAPDRLAVLADALEEAGCEETALLGHLRSPLNHLRGCWAVDLLLTRE